MASRSKKNEKKLTRVYWTSLFIFTALLIVIGAYALSIVWSYAEEYEMSRPERAINEYVDEFTQNFWSEGLGEEITSMEHRFQTDEECAQVIKSMLEDGVRYTQTASDLSLGRNNMAYNLFCGEGKFGKVILVEDEAYTDARFGMLPWKVYKDEFYLDGLYTSFRITVPTSYSVEVNGHVLGEEYIVERDIPFDNLKDFYYSYPGIPKKVTYEVDGIFGKLEPLVLDEQGNERVIDESRDDSQFLVECDDNMKAYFTDYVQGFGESYFWLLSGVGNPSEPYYQVIEYIKKGSSLAEHIYQSYLDVTAWSHTQTCKVNYINLNQAYSLGEGCYLLDMTAEVYTYAPFHGEKTNITNLYLIVINDGNSSYKIVAIQLY